MVFRHQKAFETDPCSSISITCCKCVLKANLRIYSCDMHSLMSIGILVYLFINDFLPNV